ncbi:MAG: ATP-grasp domain-containing protein, partial [Calditrichaeota bacterium]
MAHTTPLTVLCIASYFKGVDFLRECKRRGCRVFLLTSRKLDQEPWPWESIDEVFYMDAPDEDWDMQHLIAGVSHLARKEQIDRIVPLDDFDLEKAAALREHLRIPGMGDTRTRYFRDKLAMRGRAQEAGLPVPDFVHLLNEQRIREFMERVPPPWIIKPRSQASAVGITRVHSPEEVWNTMDKLGDRFSHYLMEKFLPGDVFHVDSVVYERRVVFARAHRYMTPPWSVTHEGGIFRTHTLEYGSPEEQELLRLNDQLITAFGLLRGVSHTEFIRSDEDGQFYFLETSARVG